MIDYFEWNIRKYLPSIADTTKVFAYSRVTYEKRQKLEKSLLHTFVCAFYYIYSIRWKKWE
jgi:hypothetical protein